MVNNLSEKNPYMTVNNNIKHISNSEYAKNWKLFDLLPFSEFEPRTCLTTGDEKEGLEKLKEFVRVNESLSNLMDEWLENEKEESCCELLKNISNKISGMRLIKLEPVEAIFSFILSANNNLPRITLLLDKLRQNYGKLLLITSGDMVPIIMNKKAKEDMQNLASNLIKAPNNTKYYAWFSFPSLQSIASGSVEELKSLGFGYRSQNVITAANQLLQIIREYCNIHYDSKDSKVTEADIQTYFHYLTELSRNECTKELQKLRGVGRKVSDCIALLAFDKLDCVPVDTHMWKIAWYVNHLLNQLKSSES